MLNILNVGYKIESNQQTSHWLYKAHFSDGLPIVKPLTDRFNNDSDDVNGNTLKCRAMRNKTLGGPRSREGLKWWMLPVLNFDVDLNLFWTPPGDWSEIGAWMSGIVVSFYLCQWHDICKICSSHKIQAGPFVDASLRLFYDFFAIVDVRMEMSREGGLDSGGRFPLASPTWRRSIDIVITDYVWNYFKIRHIFPLN